MSLHKLNIALFFSCFLFAETATATESSNTQETYFINANIKGMEGKKIYLASVYGDDVKRIDSTVCDTNGNCLLHISGNMPVGIYRLLLGKTYKSDLSGGDENNMDILFNHENIRFTTVASQAFDSAKISGSKENSLYFDFFRALKHKYINRLDVLAQTMHFYPADDEFYNELQKHFNKVLQEKDKYIKGFLEKNANTLAARIIKFQQSPDYFKMVVATEKMTDEQKTEYIKAHFWDALDLSDTVVLHTSLVADKIVTYISLYRNRKNTSNQQSEELKKAADAILKKVQVNDAFYDYVLTYLTNGFEKMGQDEVVMYLTSKYIDNSCRNDALKDSYEDKAEKMKKVAIGRQAPDIQMHDINGKPVKLSDINTEHTLVLFWASWCQHCQMTLPKIKAAYENINAGPKKKLEVIAISIDTDSTAWKKFVTEGNYTWLNCSDFKGWDGHAVKDYNVSGTPTMFLLDRNKKIISKPLTGNDLENDLK